MCLISKELGKEIWGDGLMMNESVRIGDCSAEFYYQC